MSEAAILSKFRHKNIIKLIEFFSTGKESFIVTEFHQGGDLQMYMEKRNFE